MQGFENVRNTIKRGGDDCRNFHCFNSYSYLVYIHENKKSRESLLKW